MTTPISRRAALTGTAAIVATAAGTAATPALERAAAARPTDAAAGLRMVTINVDAPPRGPRSGGA